MCLHIECCGRSRKWAANDLAVWYFVRHGVTTKAVDCSDEADAARILTEAGRQAIALKRKGWLQAEGLDHYMVNQELPVPGRFVASSPATRCIDTAKELLSIQALHIAPVPYIYDGIGSKGPAFGKLFQQYGYAPLREYLKVDSVGCVKDYGRRGLREIYESYPGGNAEVNVVIVFGHAVGLAAIALELAETRGIEMTDQLLDANQDECTTFKVSMDEAVFLD